MLHREATPLCIAFVASLAIHFTVIPLFTNKQFVSPFAPPTDASHLETPPLEKPEIVLGIDQSEASTLTWIGYEQYQKHLARLADVEQAAMQLEQPSPKPAAQEVVLEQPQKNIKKILDDLSETIAPVTDAATKLIDALRGLQFSFASPTPPPTVQPSHSREQVVEANPKPVSEFSDLESDPTSIVEVPRENWKTGRPIAAEGIILRPRRPSFTAHQSVTNAPNGLTAVLVIDNRGRPIDVEIIRSTGSSSIDRSLVASLYRWRAAGEKIDAVLENESIHITIHISLSK
ncbi:MAG: energy transducer TonB [Planctomycetes bacterium]|nr:energy transducer TonB [Planctomycetota bacterium]